jgi:two-component system CheB/CheR fusion protein
MDESEATKDAANEASESAEKIRPEQSKPDASRPDGALVVGVGASAGGLEAFSQLLQALPADSGLAIVFVQHLAPQHESALPALLGAKTRMPVAQATEGVKLEPNHVYVIPPNTRMGIIDSTLHLTPRQVETQYSSIDYFLRSLADAYGHRAIGVILSGTASDGALGLREIKDVGGLTFVQEPESAKYDGMPRAAIRLGGADQVLPPADIAGELARLGKNPDLVSPARMGDGSDDMEVQDRQLQQIFSILRASTGVDFSNYKTPTIKRRLQRRMLVQRIDSLDGYINFLKQNPLEVTRLYQNVLIHVTRFFREPESFDALKQDIFPQILQTRNADQPIRIWIPGCSTGEEAYSVAIGLLEFLEERSLSLPIQIFATDLSDAAVQHARTGLYPMTISEDVSAERLRKYFTVSDGHYRVAKSIRDMCIFARQDLTRDPPFSRLDLVICRNVLIYLGPVLQKKVISIFHYALRHHGFLMLGSAETVGLHAELFSIVDKKHRIYAKRSVETPAGVHFSVAESPMAQPHAGPPAPKITHAAGTAQSEANRFILDRYGPPGVIVDGNLQIIQFRGHTGPYLEPAPGEASLHLLKMAREGLLHSLRSAIHAAGKSSAPVRKDGLRIKYNGDSRDVSIEVVPLTTTAEGRNFLILFEEIKPGDSDPAPRSEAGPPPVATDGDPGKMELEIQNLRHEVPRLQQELAASREYLQSIIQDLEATNEELQSANEEILSSNEELQSTNEELDTAKEELQSTNEELNTVNEELHARNEELSRLNSDLMNLLSSVQIAIVIVDRELRIRRFTPMAEKVLNLIAADINRPIAQINPNIDCPDLVNLITDVMDHVTLQQRDVRDAQGRWYSLTVRPYKDVDNRIDGAVLSLFDVDFARRQEATANQARVYARSLLDYTSEMVLALDSELKVLDASREFLRKFQVSREETVGRSLYELGNRQWDIPELRANLEQVLSKDRNFENFEVQREFPGIGQRHMRLRARGIPNVDGPAGLIWISMDDVTASEKR